MIGQIALPYTSVFYADARLPDCNQRVFDGTFRLGL